MKFFKKHLGLISLIIALVLLDISRKELFLTIFLLYGLLIKFFLSDSLGKKLRKTLAIITWTTFLMISFILYYSNHHYPKDLMFDTGNFIEDSYHLDIPKWAKFFQGSGGRMLWIGSFFAGFVVIKRKGERLEDLFIP